MSSITCHVPAYDDPDRAQYHDVPDVAYDPPRPPGAFVVSGPMNGRPKGRRLRSLTDHRHRTVESAVAWAKGRYARVVANVTPEGQHDMWALLVVPR